MAQTRHGTSGSPARPAAAAVLLTLLLVVLLGATPVVASPVRTTADSTDRPPVIGALDVVRREPGGLRVQGWGIDQSTSGPTQVHLYVDGVGLPVWAEVPRPDLVGLAPFDTVNHGFDVLLPLAPIAGRTSRTVCAYVMGFGPPVISRLLRCATVDVDDPAGSLDVGMVVPGGLRVAGWALDPDTTGPVPVHVYVDGVGVAVLSAAVIRPDVASAWPGYGAAHGFDATVAVAPDPAHPSPQVCVYAIDVAPPGGNRLLGCRQVSHDPIGSFDEYGYGGNFLGRPLRSIGVWALDPDTAAPVEVEVRHVTPFGTYDNVVLADHPRPDVSAAYPGYGDAHGYDVVAGQAYPGDSACVWARNAPGTPGNDVLLGCRQG